MFRNMQEMRHESMSLKRIHTNYNNESDGYFKDFLISWTANSLLDISYREHFADVSVDSRIASEYKSAISAKINSAPYFLTIVGSDSLKNQWVRWEIADAFELDKEIVAVKTNYNNELAPELFQVGAKLAGSFTFADVVRALDELS